MKLISWWQDEAGISINPLRVAAITAIGGENHRTKVHFSGIDDDYVVIDLPYTEMLKDLNEALGGKE